MGKKGRKSKKATADSRAREYAIQCLEKYKESRGAVTGLELGTAREDLPKPRRRSSDAAGAGTATNTSTSIISLQVDANTIGGTAAAAALGSPAAPKSAPTAAQGSEAEAADDGPDLSQALTPVPVRKTPGSPAAPKSAPTAAQGSEAEAADDGPDLSQALTPVPMHKTPGSPAAPKSAPTAAQGRRTSKLCKFIKKLGKKFAAVCSGCMKPNVKT